MKNSWQWGEQEVVLVMTGWKLGSTSEMEFSCKRCLVCCFWWCCFCFGDYQSRQKLWNLWADKGVLKTTIRWRLHTLQACQWGISAAHWLQKIDKWICHSESVRSWYSNGTCDYKITSRSQRNGDNNSPQWWKFGHWIVSHDGYAGSGLPWRARIQEVFSLRRSRMWPEKAQN